MEKKEKNKTICIIEGGNALFFDSEKNLFYNIYKRSEQPNREIY